MKNFSLLSLVFVLSSGAFAQTKPNVVIIHTDEHNFRTLGCYRDQMSSEQAFMWGDSNIVETPHIDNLAKKGILCTSFYANSPVCTPSRASLLSGLYPQNTGAYKNDRPLKDSIESFAKPLIAEGYRTGYAGKWHLDGDSKPGWTPNRKFGFLDNTYMFNRGHWKKLNEKNGVPFVESKNDKGQIKPLLNGADENSFTTDFLTSKAIEFIEKDDDSPFLFMLSIPDPHGPNSVRAPYSKMFDSFIFSKPTSYFKEMTNLPSWAKPQANTISDDGLKKYFGMVKCIDDNVGRIINALEKNKLIDNTIIIFTADHGDLLGEHKKDNKGVPFEASSKVPFIICNPSILKSNEVVNDAMSNVDFKPTLLAILGIKATAGCEGKNVSSAFLKGNSKKTDNIAFVRYNSWVGAFTDRYKIIFSMDSDPWLLDLELDPNELVNRFNDSDYSDIKERLAVSLKTYGVSSHDDIALTSKIMDELNRTISGDL